MKQSILSASGLCKSFAHNGNQLHILSGLDLELYQGEFTVVMGASGAGKSTLLYALGGMDRATAGQVLYKGEDADSCREPGRLAAGVAVGWTAPVACSICSPPLVRDCETILCGMGIPVGWSSTAKGLAKTWRRTRRKSRHLSCNVEDHGGDRSGRDFKAATIIERTEPR